MAKTPKEVSYEEIKPIEWLDAIITKAMSSGASDIHFDNFLDKFVVRFRINGILYDIENLPLSYSEKIISSLKVMAQLDITENRRPADGHILYKPKGLLNASPIDLRLSIFPTISGPAAVMRILNRQDLFFKNLEELGIDKQMSEKLRNAIKRSGGMVLVTGPGGSGKTTTLYTFLNTIHSQEIKRNIITMEDPVELYFPGMRQSQIQPAIGYTFAEGLRSILRQDPDVVMFGEIRDDETAEITIRAALTGSLFFSTMHTTNSVGAINRFLEFGLPRSLVASALLVIIGQRLVRTICPSCKTKVSVSKQIPGLSEFLKNSQNQFFQGKGCNACGGSGYGQRVGIYEIMFISKKIQEMIINGERFTEIEKQARAEGMQTLREIAIEKALQGLTTIEEVLRVTPL